MKGCSTFPQSSKTGASTSDGLVSYPRHLFWKERGGSYFSTEMQSVYFTAPANAATILIRLWLQVYIHL